MNLFTLSLQLNNFPIKGAQRHLQQIQKIPAEAYSSYVEHKKEEIVNFHLKHNDFYKQFFEKEKFGSWNEIPVMQKQNLQRPLEERLSNGFNRKKIHIGKTSGSAGHPFIFAKDKFCHALSWAIFEDRYKTYGIDLNNSLEARFYGIPLDKKGYLKERLKDKLAKRHRFPIFNLNDEMLQDIFLKFQKEGFEYVNGYTSSIVLFATFLKEKNVVLKDICPTLKVCIVTSEMLFEEDRKLLENQFQIPIVNEYGSSETGLIAFQDTNSELALVSEDLFIEVLDDENMPAPPGVEGKIVVTALYNKAHPFIRYEIGDRGILEQNQTSKEPILAKLTGRTNDIAVLSNGKVVPGLSFYYVTKSVIENSGKIKEFVIQQLAPDVFKFIYVGENLSSEKISEIKKAVELYISEGLELEFEKVDFLDRSKRGKLKQFEKLF